MIRRLASPLLMSFTLAIPSIAGAAVSVREAGTTFETGGATIYFEVRGNAAGMPLFVVNGGPGFEHSYVHCSDVWDVIAKKRKVIFYDQRGTGRSGALKPGQSCTLADQIADLEALRAHLGFDRIDLLGHSWGGYLVMAYMALHGDHVAHLVIVDSAAPKWSDTAFLFKDVYPEGTEKQQAVSFVEELGDSAALGTDLREYLGMLFYDPDHRDRFLAKASGYHYYHEVNKAVTDDLARFDLNPELPKFRIPTLVITGRYDMNVAPSVAWKIHKAIPGSEFAVFERSGHIPYYEEPDAFRSRLERFLARTPLTGGNEADHADRPSGDHE
jgi:proline iminopeptidase